MAKHPYFRSTGSALGYRSGLEDVNVEHLQKHDIPVQYEQFKLSYTPPVKRYTPDFILPNGLVIETKGWFQSADRSKHKLIKDQHPNLEIRFVFSNPHSKIGKKSKTTYAKWCETHGFQYARELIPVEWFTEELPPEAYQAAIDVLGWSPAQN